ncbi:hypothetical protein PUN4_150107 [Paraburkholderia unamae]|nr:hypothetical protein PUN4_150107 [Paraburkholderia unamae]
MATAASPRRRRAPQDIPAMRYASRHACSTLSPMPLRNPYPSFRSPVKGIGAEICSMLKIVINRVVKKKTENIRIKFKSSIRHAGISIKNRIKIPAEGC